MSDRSLAQCRIKRLRRAAKIKLTCDTGLSGPHSLRCFSTLPRSFSSATSAVKRGIRCAVNRPPPHPYKLAGCGSPFSCRQAAPRAFGNSHVSFVPGKGMERPVRCLDGEGSVRAPNCSSIPQVARDAQSGTPEHSGQSATIGLSQRSAIIRLRTGEVTEARTEAEAALAAYMVAWRELPGGESGSA